MVLEISAIAVRCRAIATRAILSCILIAIVGGGASIGATTVDLKGGDCIFRVQLFAPWRQLDPQDARMAVTDMKASERRKGVVVPPGRHLIQGFCEPHSMPEPAWIARLKDRLLIPEDAKYKWISLKIYDVDVRALEIDYVWKSSTLHSTFWCFYQGEVAVTLHLFGHGDGPGLDKARMSALNLFSKMRITTPEK